MRVTRAGVYPSPGTSRSRARSRLTVQRLSPWSAPPAVAPRARIVRGRVRARSWSRNGRQSLTCCAVGFAALQRTALWNSTSPRVQPARSMHPLSTWPAGPTNCLPRRSSFPPGPSPTNAVFAPFGTVGGMKGVRAVCHRPHARQFGFVGPGSPTSFGSVCGFA